MIVLEISICLLDKLLSYNDLKNKLYGLTGSFMVAQAKICVLITGLLFVCAGCAGLSIPGSLLPMLLFVEEDSAVLLSEHNDNKPIAWAKTDTQSDIDAPATAASSRAPTRHTQIAKVDFIMNLPKEDSRFERELNRHLQNLAVAPPCAKRR